MRFRTTLMLFMLVALVGVGLWLSDRSGKAERARLQVGSPLLKWRAGDEERLVIETSTLRIVLIKRESEWFLQEPVRARADAGEVERILGVLESLPREDIVTREQREQRGLELSDYGLTEPRAHWLLQDGVQTLEWFVGADAPLGDLTYVRLQGSRNVIATAQALRDLVPAAGDALRDARVLRGSSERVSRVELHRPGLGFVRLRREDGQWLLRQPVEGRADAGLVTLLLDQLFALRAKRFVWDPPVTTSALPVTATAPDLDVEQQLEPHGLSADEARARLQVWMDGDLEGYELVIGNTVAQTNSEAYAMRTDSGSIYAIDPTELGWLVVTDDELRARDVFGLAPAAVQRIQIRKGDRKLVLERDSEGSWLLHEPVTGRADQQAVEDLLAGISKWQTLEFISGDATNQAADAFADEPAMLRLDTRTVTEDAPLPSLAPLSPAAIGAPATGPDVWDGDGQWLRIGTIPAATSSVYVCFDGSREIRRMAASALACLGEDPVNVLSYRDRTMLSVSPLAVQRVTVMRLGTTQSVVRVGDSWVADSATTAVATDVVEDLLFFTANLRALRAEILNPTSLAAYGLEPGTCVITLGLSGDTGIRKSIVLGAQAGEAGRYAMIMGQDVVYVLTAATADLLSRSPLLSGNDGD